MGRGYAGGEVRCGAECGEGTGEASGLLVRSLNFFCNLSSPSIGINPCFFQPFLSIVDSSDLRRCLVKLTKSQFPLGGQPLPGYGMNILRKKELDGLLYRINNLIGLPKTVYRVTERK